MPEYQRHRLTEVDEQLRIANCSVCGPDVKIVLMPSRRQCRNQYLKGKRRTYPATKLSPAQLPTAAEQKRWKKYRLTPAEYNRMCEKQRHRCAICGSKTKLVVDHDHITGKVRQLLCTTCNTGLGMFKESPELLKAAVRYLAEHASETERGNNAGTAEATTDDPPPRTAIRKRPRRRRNTAASA
ncbi:HNH endonuclease [Gordonia phage Chidiebere]|uniref:HNH endonuclease n=1 Tax=Gordonia phage Chidiebere TaxID=2656530 RepID=A0A649VLJ9_9CAUD|nr:endonuclease VII [Gordonia phage Chidiebere]QGJ93015.1 HNH endonuclease [Gordonia phage Chidiebere]